MQLKYQDLCSEAILLSRRLQANASFSWPEGCGGSATTIPISLLSGLEQLRKNGALGSAANVVGHFTLDDAPGIAVLITTIQSFRIFGTQLEFNWQSLISSQINQ